MTEYTRPAACGQPWSELQQYITEKVIDGVPIKVLDLRGLLLTKQGMRPQDRADALMIRRALGQE